MDRLLHLKYAPDYDHVVPSRTTMSASPSQQTGSTRPSRVHTPSSVPPGPPPRISSRATLQNEFSNEPEATEVPPSSTSLPASVQSSAQPPTLTPFFTLVEDGHSSEHHHPLVHYIFSDDESDLITDAALRVHENFQTHALTDQYGAQTASAASQQQNPPVKERYVILDLNADGTSVVSAQSMTPDWQVLNTEITPAPTLEGNGGGGSGGGSSRLEDGKGKNMMLRIVGTEAQKPVEVAEAERLGLEGLVDEYAKRMEELRRVVEGMGGAGVGDGRGVEGGGRSYGLTGRLEGEGKGKGKGIDTGDNNT